MAARLPFISDPERPDRHAIVRRDDQIVAHVAAVSPTLVVGGEVACPGISGVATDPRYRGEGYLSALLEFWRAELEAPLVELGGDRTWYGRFGWENAGREQVFRITRRSLPDDRPSVAVEEYTGRTEQITRLQALHAAEPYRVTRTTTQAARVYDRADTVTLLSGTTIPPTAVSTARPPTRPSGSSGVPSKDVSDYSARRSPS